ncbi:hypothetical protein MC7420_2442 [Coleofasciculus chthonoplastes PCC 7420]|uniref:Uncharacterized protein n=1 Tax=Coleofasciculus chthonoplastes PCC 7420 TaxID=118168 RepID=B4VZR1_9CYAN|nr:hypothetical protein MC7420_2442 [Coleofasciculus chthonoplastes PCC 7420]
MFPIRAYAPSPPAPLPPGYALPTSFLNIVRSRFQAVS